MYKLNEMLSLRFYSNQHLVTFRSFGAE